MSNKTLRLRFLETRLIQLSSAEISMKRGR